MADEQPKYGDWYQKIPEALRGQLPEEALKEIQAGWMKEADYRQKTQEVASIKKIMDANPGLNFEEAVQAHRWAREQWPAWQQSYNDLKAQATRAAAAPAPAVNGAGRARGKWIDEVAVEDFYETERLRRRFTELQDEWGPQFAEAALKKVREEWYEKDEIPRLNQWAGGYMGTMLNLLKAIWPKEGPGPEQVLKEAAVRQTPDLVNVYNDLVQTGSQVKEGGFNEGFKKGREEAEQDLRKRYNITEPGSTAPATTGPLGGSTPTWKKPDNVTPKTAGDRFAAVMQKVEAKHGALPR